MGAVAVPWGTSIQRPAILKTRIAPAIALEKSARKGSAHAREASRNSIKGSITIARARKIIRNPVQIQKRHSKPQPQASLYNTETSQENLQQLGKRRAAVEEETTINNEESHPSLPDDIGVDLRKINFV